MAADSRSKHKGISLPVDAVIIIAVAVLVLVVISVMFSSSTGTSTKTMSHADAWNRGCSIAKVQGCLKSAFKYSTAAADKAIFISGYDPDGDDAGVCDYTKSIGECGDNLLVNACKNFFGDSTQDQDTCWKRCCGA